MELAKIFRFEAAHMIRNHPGACKRLHGHSWVLTVFVEGKINPLTGMVVDYFDIKKAVQPIVDKLDHQFFGNGTVEIMDEVGRIVPMELLASIPEMRMPWLPTSENLLIWIADRMPERFEWTRLTINETCTSSATLSNTEYKEIRQIREVETLFGETHA